MCLLLFLFFFLRLSARVWNVRWFQTENFISLHRVTHNNTHAYTFINTRTRVRDAKRKANNGKHWLISISPNDDDDDEKENTVLERYWFGTVITSRGLRILSFYFPCSPSTNRRKKRKPKPPKTFFFRGIESCNFHRMLLNGEHDISMKYDLKQKWKSNRICGSENWMAFTLHLWKSIDVLLQLVCVWLRKTGNQIILQRV